jgi:predicted anti-sigma-YlaC factor YlaD
VTTVPHLDDERAQRFLEGLLPAAEAAQAEGHLAACPACRALFESYRSLAGALGDLAAPEPPADFTAAVLARVERRERVTAWENRLGAAILAAAAGAAAALFASAGENAWAGVVDAALRTLGGAATPLRIGAEAAAPVVSALRPQIIAGCAALTLPLFLALARLASPRRAGPA